MHFPFLIKKQKNGKNAPFLCVGLFFRSNYMVKYPFGAFFTKDEAFFHFVELATLRCGFLIGFSILHSEQQHLTAQSLTCRWPR